MRAVARRAFQMLCMPFVCMPFGCIDNGQSL
jgi:hypothetical protein